MKGAAATQPLPLEAGGDANRLEEGDTSVRGARSSASSALTGLDWGGGGMFLLRLDPNSCSGARTAREASRALQVQVALTAPHCGFPGCQAPPTASSRGHLDAANRFDSGDFNRGLLHGRQATATTRRPREKS